MPEWTERLEALQGPDGEAIPERWAETPLGDGWLARARIEWNGARFIVTELRIVREPPTEDDYRRMVEAGLPTLLSPTGLTIRRLRSLKFEGVTRSSERVKAEMRAQLPETERRQIEESEARWRQAMPRSSQRRRWTDAEYVAVANMYVERVLDGSPSPVVDVARKWHYSPARIRQMLTHARRRGWLTPTTRRSPGGTLTREALAILGE
jgi:hypothetical protein